MDVSSSCCQKPVTTQDSPAKLIPNKPETCSICRMPFDDTRPAVSLPSSSQCQQRYCRGCFVELVDDENNWSAIPEALKASGRADGTFWARMVLLLTLASLGFFNLILVIMEMEDSYISMVQAGMIICSAVATLMSPSATQKGLGILAVALAICMFSCTLLRGCVLPAGSGELSDWPRRDC